MLEENSQNNGFSYVIRVKNNIAMHWVNFFEGWSITNQKNGEVLLSSSNVDQARLHGALNKIRDLNLTLLSVKRILS